MPLQREAAPRSWPRRVRRGAAAIAVCVGVWQAARLDAGAPAGSSAGGAFVAPWRPRAARLERLVARATEPSGTFKQGITLVERGSDRMKGMQLINEAANDGCLHAQTCLGCFYEKGLFGIPRDMNTALKWFERAAAGGDANANFNLGVLNLYGNGVPQNKFQAGKYFKAAAELGHVDGMTNLAGMCIKGDGIPRDMQLGAQWLVRAAQKTDCLDDLINKISNSALDSETRVKLSQMIDKLRDVNTQQPFVKRESDQSRHPRERSDDRGQW